MSLYFGEHQFSADEVGGMEDFAARRNARLNGFTDEIRPQVEKALREYAAGDADWASGLIDSASVLWLETFQKETGEKTRPDAPMATFRRELGETLAKTGHPADPPEDVQVDRVANWIGVYGLNSATHFAQQEGRLGEKRWLTMEDSHVRASHRAVAGQTLAAGAPFDIDGAKLQFPGEPVGPLPGWIECRCWLFHTGGDTAMAIGGDENNFTVTYSRADSPVQELEAPAPEEPEEEEGDIDDVADIPIHGVLAPIGVTSADGRRFADDAVITHRQMPLPFNYQPSVSSGHDGSVTPGRIDRVWVDPEDKLIKWEGMLRGDHPATNDVIEGMAFGSHRQASADVGQMSMGFAEEEWNGMPIREFSEIEIAGLTLTAGTSAFAEAYAAIGTWDDECDCDDEAHDENDASDELEPVAAAATFAPGTHDGPGWITNPRATERIRSYWVHGKGAAKIRWGVPGDFNRCRKQLVKYVQNPNWLAGLCANMHKEAIKVWPGQEDGGRHHAHVASAGTSFAPTVVLEPIVASAGPAPAVHPPRTWFEDPKLTRKTRLTITEDGRVYGHLATWDSCHVGMNGICSTPPRSASNYAFATGGVLETDGGDVVVGHLVAADGHAPVRGIGTAAAMAHYDKPEAVFADVVYGEDSIGLWYSGAMRQIPEDERRTIRATGTMSGDWRPINGYLELIAATLVNTPGHPIQHLAFSAEAGRQTALVASAIVVDDNETQSTISTDQLAGMVEVVADRLEERAAERQLLAAADAVETELSAEIESKEQAELDAALAVIEGAN